MCKWVNVQMGKYADGEMYIPLLNSFYYQHILEFAHLHIYIFAHLILHIRTLNY